VLTRLNRIREASLHRSRATRWDGNVCYLPLYISIYPRMLQHTALWKSYTCRMAVPLGAVYIANLSGNFSRTTRCPASQWTKVILPIKLRHEPGPESPLSESIVLAKCCSRNAFAWSFEAAGRLFAKVQCGCK